ncbi:MAG: glyoxalase [Actinobacteria bacterium]|nr:glyoxalase [Actinomycetota bacterium]
MASIVALEIADPPAAWAELGFTVENGVCGIDGVAYVLDGAGAGVVSWTVAGLDGAGVDGLPDGPSAALPPPAAHPNGVVALDHLVISTPNLGRTIERFEAAGLELRRTRDAGRIHQAFFKAGTVVLEVIGPPQPNGDGPARFWGLAWTVADLAATAAFLGDRLHAAKDAVQKGRQIATLDKQAGSTVAHAFMSPEPR